MRKMDFSISSGMSTPIIVAPSSKSDDDEEEEKENSTLLTSLPPQFEYDLYRREEMEGYVVFERNKTYLNPNTKLALEHR